MNVTVFLNFIFNLSIVMALRVDSLKLFIIESLVSENSEVHTFLYSI